MSSLWADLEEASHVPGPTMTITKAQYGALRELLQPGEIHPSVIEFARIAVERDRADRAEPRGPKSGFPQVDPDFAIRAEPSKPLDVDALAAFLHWYTGRQTDHTGPTCDACREDAREYAALGEPQPIVLGEPAHG